VDIKTFAAELLGKLNAEAKAQAQQGQRKASISVVMHKRHMEIYGPRCRESNHGVLVKPLSGVESGIEGAKYPKTFLELVKKEISDNNVQLELEERSWICGTDRDGDACCQANQDVIVASASW